jgi:peptidoglycan L-alanyl-D-glutamate endopeptidase CwlK
MPSFGAESLKKLSTCDKDIQTVMNEAIKHYDFTILYGTRTVEEQFALYQQGRKLVDGVWTKVGATVTNLDGKIKKSNHNYTPSRAIDIAPYPIDWNDTKRFVELSKVVKEAMKTVGIDLQWGGDWERFTDYPHYELKTPIK